MKLYSFDDVTILGFANDLKERIIGELEREGIIDPAQRTAVRYAFVLSTRGILGDLIDKFWGVEDDGHRMSFVRFHTLEEIQARESAHNEINN